MFTLGDRIYASMALFDLSAQPPVCCANCLIIPGWWLRFGKVNCCESSEWIAAARRSVVAFSVVLVLVIYLYLMNSLIEICAHNFIFTRTIANADRAVRWKMPPRSRTQTIFARPRSYHRSNNGRYYLFCGAFWWGEGANKKEFTNISMRCDHWSILHSRKMRKTPVVEQ